MYVAISTELYYISMLDALHICYFEPHKYTISYVQYCAVNENFLTQLVLSSIVFDTISIVFVTISSVQHCAVNENFLIIYSDVQDKLSKNKSKR